jgi:hypothetical protein
MPSRLRILFGLLVLAPLAALAALGWGAARGAEARAAAEVRALLERKLDDLALLVDGVTGELEGGLLNATLRLPTDPEALRALGRR